MHDGQSPLQRALGLVPLIEAEADECERLGRLTDTLVDAFRASRLFWMSVPEELGGEELDVIGQIEVVEELTRADGSAGWTLMANAASTSFAAAGCDDEAVKAMFPHPDDMAVTAGMLGPGGTATPDGDGYRVTGRYSFGSGATHATWIAAGAVVPDRDDQLVVVVPRQDVRMLGNWDVLGLGGTGSVDYALDDCLVPASYVFSRSAFQARRGGPSSHMGVQPIGAAGHAAVALGLAKRALEELVSVVDAGKQRLGAAPIVEQQMFRHEFVAYEGRFQAARAFVFDTFGEALDAAERGDAMSEPLVHRVRQSTTVATEFCYEVVEFAYRWAGSAGLRQPGRLGRCMRDMHAATQHTYVDVNSLVNAFPSVLDAYRAAEAG